MSADAGAWPLSAAATAVLRDPKVKPEEVLKLALKELVLRRTWRLEDRGRRGLVGRKRKLSISRGPAGVPVLVPLGLLDRHLGWAIDRPTDLRKAMRTVLRRETSLPEKLKHEARDDLAARGLVDLDRKRVLGLVVRTVVHRTADGDRLAAEAARRCSGASGVAGAELAALGGLVLLLDAGARAAVADAVARARRDESMPMIGDSGAESDLHLDLGDLDVLDGLDLSLDADLDASIDAAVDDGGSDAGGDGGD